MAINQTFDHGRSDAKMLSRPSFDIILAIATARQAACPTAQLLNREAGPQSARDATAVRRALCGGGLVSPRRDNFQTGRFFEVRAPEAQESARVGEMATVMNDPFTRAFQPMLKPSGLDDAIQADETSSVGSVMG